MLRSTEHAGSQVESHSRKENRAGKAGSRTEVRADKVQLSTQGSKWKEEWSLPSSDGLRQIQAQGCGMKIEVLYVPNCPNHAVALERLREILSSESFQKHVNEMLV